MKNILLTSTALVAFAGAAFADSNGVSFAGSATLGYNEDSDDGALGDNDGFYWDANVAVTLSQELDNGIMASVTFNFDAADTNAADGTAGADGSVLEAGDYLLTLSSDTASLYFGQTTFAAETYWASAGDMEADGFSEADGETVLRGDVMMAGITASLSYAVADANDVLATDSVNQLSLAATGTFGNFTLGVAYQESATDDFQGPAANYTNEDFSNDEIFGISGSTTFSGATVTVAYADNTDSDITSTGVKVSYPFGPVTATAYYVMEDAGTGADPDDNFGINVAYEAGAIAVALDYQDDQGTAKTAIDGSYDVGNGLTVFAGMYMEDGIEDEFYVAGSYDLGNGASILVAYADAQDDTDDEVGANEYQRGTTIEVGFTF